MSTITRINQLDKFTKDIRSKKTEPSKRNAAIASAELLADELARKSKGAQKKEVERLQNTIASVVKVSERVFSGDLEQAHLLSAGKQARKQFKRVVASYLEAAQESKSASKVKAEITAKVEKSSSFDDIDRMLREELNHERNSSLFEEYRKKSQSIAKAISSIKRGREFAFAQSPVIVLSNLLATQFTKVGHKAKAAHNSIVVEDQLIAVTADAKSFDDLLKTINSRTPDKVTNIGKPSPFMLGGKKYQAIWLMSAKDINNFQRVNNGKELTVNKWGVML